MELRIRVKQHKHHTHDDGNSHEHEHEHGHIHNHEHEHEHTHIHVKDEDTAVLKYMFDHNCHHTGELRELAGKLMDSGKPEAAELIKKAVNHFGQGNAELEKALNALKAD
jgi:hypothetical protein